MMSGRVREKQSTWTLPSWYKLKVIKIVINVDVAILPQNMAPPPDNHLYTPRERKYAVTSPCGVNTHRKHRKPLPPSHDGRILQRKKRRREGANQYAVPPDSLVKAVHYLPCLQRLAT